MKKYILRVVPALLAFFITASCTKEKAADDFQLFGELSISNATIYNTLHAKVDSVEQQLTDGTFYKLRPGLNHVQISGRGSRPQDLPVHIFDTLMRIEADKKYQFFLLQPSADERPIVILNDQKNEPTPAPGKVKIRIANFAKFCLPDVVDVEMIMNDYNYENISTDTIRQADRNFRNFGVYNLLDQRVAAAGSVFFTILAPVTKAPIAGPIYGVELDNYELGTWYTVLTIYIQETPDDYGEMTGSDGKRYRLDVKALFIN